MDILIGVSTIGFILTLVMLYALVESVSHIAGYLRALEEKLPLSELPGSTDLKSIEKRLEWFQSSLETGDGRRALSFDSQNIERLLHQILVQVSGRI